MNDKMKSERDPDHVSYYYGFSFQVESFVRNEDFHRAQIVKFVSFTGAFTGKYVVKILTERY